MSASVYIGTSGFSYNHWDGVYYPPGLRPRERLAFYSREFSTVEINATFYHLQSAHTFQQWQGETPPEFKFTIKGSRYITHVKRFRDSRDAVRRFFGPAKELGDKLAVTLWQTPPNFPRDLDVLDEFLSVLKEEAPAGIRQTFEFRSKDWLTEETYAILDSRGCGVVIPDSDRYPAAENIVTSGFVYVRFHGRTADGYNYTDSELMPWSEKIKKWLADGHDVFVYFNNDTEANAVRNAATLKNMI